MAKGKMRKGGRDDYNSRSIRSDIDYIDYKDTEMLQKLLTQRGKIFSRKRSGNTAKVQRMAQKAIKRARFMGMLPYTS